MAIWHRGMSGPPKDPAATKDYRVDWSDYLQSGEVLVNGVFTTPAGLTMVVTSLEDSNTSVLGYWSGGTAGEKYAIECTITTDSVPPRIDTRTFYIEVADL